MGDVLPFRPAAGKARARSSALCRSGFHKWVVVKDKVFDVKQGKLVTCYTCARCGAQKTTAQ